jgi:hypothetical protein
MLNKINPLKNERKIEVLWIEAYLGVKKFQKPTNVNLTKAERTKKQHHCNCLQSADDCSGAAF